MLSLWHSLRKGVFYKTKWNAYFQLLRSEHFTPSRASQPAVLLKDLPATKGEWGVGEAAEQDSGFHQPAYLTSLSSTAVNSSCSNSLLDPRVSLPSHTNPTTELTQQVSAFATCHMLFTSPCPTEPFCCTDDYCLLASPLNCHPLVSVLLLVLGDFMLFKSRGESRK